LSMQMGCVVQYKTFIVKHQDYIKNETIWNHMHT
jgi:hypothetical protein